MTVPVGLKPRNLEIRLLTVAGTYALTGCTLVSLLLPGKPGWQTFIAGILTVAGFFVVHWIWRKGGFCADPFLLPVLMVLTATGISFLFRLNVAYGLRQLAWLLAGVGALLLVTTLHKNCHLLAKYKFLFAATGALALVLPIFFGVEVGGARSWLDFKVFYLQPSEFVKLLFVLFFSAYFAEDRTLLVPDSEEMSDRLMSVVRHWGPLLGMWVISLVLLVFQKDLGMALIYFATFLALVYVATGRAFYMALGLILFFLGGIIAYLMFDHVHTRVEIWLNPWQESLVTGASYQVIQSLLAINAGGIIGSGLGAGYPGFIPAVHTDFIFAAICEEMGLLGGTGIILLYMILVFRGFAIALKARDDFSTLLAAGLTILLGLQVFIIIAGVIKLLPLTGITLPFISYGGSSLVANFLLVGLLMNISHHSGDFH